MHAILQLITLDKLATLNYKFSYNNMKLTNSCRILVYSLPFMLYKLIDHSKVCCKTLKNKID